MIKRFCVFLLCFSFMIIPVFAEGPIEPIDEPVEIVHEDEEDEPPAQLPEVDQLNEIEEEPEVFRDFFTTPFSEFTITELLLLIGVFISLCRLILLFFKER